MKKFLLLVLIGTAVNAYAQFPPVNIPGSEIRKITSLIVPGQEYELHILLPANYKNSNKKYPVVYLMDSQWDFPLLKSIYGQQYFDGFIPELIIVGVTWGGLHPNPDSLRARDYTPTRETSAPQSGGADKFLSFMKQELFPFIETNYKADPTNRTLMGCSLGGLLTLYALFTQPGMFNGYAAASPAIGWDKEVLSKFEEQFYTTKQIKPARLYMTIGEVERNVPGFKKLAKHMSDHNNPAINFKPVVLENTGHSGTKSETYARGLQYIFERPKLAIAAAVLNKYEGIYHSVNGETLTIKNEGGKLHCNFSPHNQYQLFAASETEFYSTAEFFNISFSPGLLKLVRYGDTEIYSRKK